MVRGEVVEGEEDFAGTLLPLTASILVGSKGSRTGSKAKKDEGVDRDGNGGLSAGLEAGTIENIKTDELAGLEIRGLLARIGGGAVDDGPGIDDNRAILNGENRALYAAGATHDWLNEPATRLRQVDPSGLGPDNANQTLAGRS